MPASPTLLIPAVVSSLVVWRVYQRVRRNIGPQPFQPRRLMVRIGIFALIIGLITVVSLGHARVLLGFAAGLLPGMGLAWLGLRLTRFETTPVGRFYTPNMYLGIALSLLMVGRVAYRLALLYGTQPAPDQAPPAQLLQSPLTFFVVGLLFGYYLIYSIGVLVHCRRLQPTA